MRKLLITFLFVILFSTSAFAAFGDLVDFGFATTEDPCTATLATGPATAGNMLLAAGIQSATAATDTPADFTLISQATGNFTPNWYYKLSDGTESSVALDANTMAGVYTCVILELDGGASGFSGALGSTAGEDETNIATTTTGPQSSGTTGTTTDAVELVVAFFSSDACINTEVTPAVDNGFTLLNPNGGSVCEVASANPMAVFATLVTSMTGTYTANYSFSDTGDEMYGAIATFRQAAATGLLPPGGLLGILP